jgi:tRNA(Ile2) C34 agmatinyltransferase TiaS
MEISRTSSDRQAPVCPKCAGAGKRVGAHENVAYFRCLACTRIWARRLE